MAVKIGLLGGSFDPVHLSHIALAQTAYKALGLDQVELIPAGNPWQRPALKASPEHRLAMLQLAIRHDPALKINPMELERHGPTYTVDTIQALAHGPCYVWILGADQLERFCSWREWQTIVNHVDLAVAARPGSSLNAPQALADYLQHQGKTLQHIPLPASTISATDIRHRLRHQQSTHGLLDPAVADYIAAHSLYHAGTNN